LKNDCSFQTGGGGPSLAVARYVRDYMKENSVHGSYCIGGITGYMADMLKEGLFRTLFDVQSFDASVTDSIANNPNHVEADVSWYANPFNKGCLVNDLDVSGARGARCRRRFNVDVLRATTALLRGAPAAHSDTARARISRSFTIPSKRNGVPSIRERGRLS
jgi:citrate lyase subunit alpha/citrate CoA-transferase